MKHGASSFATMASGRGGIGAALLRTVLWPASIVYERVIHLRNRRYDSDASRAARIGIPVISVGNITTGGTGKTPLVIDIALRLLGMGRRPAVVSRGYRAGADGRNDELVLIEQRATGVICIANPDRVAGARQAVSAHNADTVILDDGFQHRRIARDVDIVTIDATRPFGVDFMLPRGDLREPPRGLSRATLLVITRADQVTPSELEGLRATLGKHARRVPIIAARHLSEPPRLLDGAMTAEHDLRTLPVYLMSAIGNPRAFEHTAQHVSGKICGHACFRDHHRYSNTDAARVCETARAAGAEAVLVTEKDAVKLEAIASNFSLPVHVVGVRIDFLDDGGKIMDAVLREAICGGMAADDPATVSTGRSERA